MTFKKALLLSLLFHIALIVLVTYGPTPKNEMVIDAMVVEQKPVTEQTSKQDKAIKAVSIDANEIEEAVKKLKLEKQQAEKERLDKIAKAKKAELLAKRRRIAEEKRLAALKREAQKRAEQQRKEKLRLSALKKERDKLLKQQKEAERKRQAEKARKAKAAREAEQKRAEALRAAKAAAAKQSRINEALQKYKGLIINAISQNWILPANVNSQLSCEFRIRLAPDGTVVLTQLSRSSGDTILDRSAETAINKASPLPVPEDRELFELFRDIHLTVRPEQARG